MRRLAIITVLLLVCFITGCTNTTIEKKELTAKEKHLLKSISTDGVYKYLHGKQKAKIEAKVEIYKDGKADSKALETTIDLSKNNHFYIQLNDKRVAINGISTDLKINTEGKQATIVEGTNLNTAKEMVFLIMAINPKIDNTKKDLDSMIKSNETVVVVKGSKK